MCKTIFSIAFFCCISLVANGGKVVDSCRVRVCYEAAGKRLYEKGHDEIRRSDYELLIGKHMSTFKNVLHYKCRTYKDSLISAAGISSIYEYRRSPYSGKMSIDYLVYKNYPSSGRLLFKNDIMDFYFYYDEPIPEIAWNFQDGDTTIVGYACKKAVTEHRGRTWTAWYAIDLPYDNGPWKLQGLPGLILCARESKGEFAFECTAIENGNNEPIEIDTHKAEKMTGKQYNEKLKEYWYDQSRFISRLHGLKCFDVPTDTTVQKRFTPCLIETY